MKLSKLLKKAELLNCYYIYDHKINGITDNSKDVKANYLYFSLNNNTAYIDEAINKGAKSIVLRERIGKEKDGINYLYINDIKKCLALFLSLFYRKIIKQFYFIGVTGTNGKTTVTTLLYDFLKEMGKKPLLIGTNGFYYEKSYEENVNTTPSIVKTYEYLARMRALGARYVVMEVSSIGLAEERVTYLPFNMAIGTNLTQDHLDYHVNMDNYKYTKARLFEMVKRNAKNVVILNKDDSAYETFKAFSTANVISYAINEEAMFKALNVKANATGLTFSVISEYTVKDLKSNLIGQFNVYNILAVLAAVSFLGYKISTFSSFLLKEESVKGRMNIIKARDFNILLDFAHTPDSMLQVLKGSKYLCQNALRVVFGCGGNRDKSKRSIMANIAENYALKTYITNDNPRDEDMHLIARDIAMGFKGENYEIILDREEAVTKALNEAMPGDLVAILGKGIEKSQIIKGVNYPYSDIMVINKWLKGHN